MLPPFIKRRWERKPTQRPIDFTYLWMRRIIMAILRNRDFCLALFTLVVLSGGLVAQTYECPDVNKDTIVDLIDFGHVSAAWLSQGPGLGGDIVTDGIVDEQDLGALGDQWLGTPPCTVPTSKLHMADTLATLKTLFIQHNDMALVAGLETVNDGGGGVFIYDSQSQAASDEAMVVAHTYLPGNWLRKPEPEINVKDFGAKGDGVSDDTSAIQAAVDYARQNGNAVVYMPPGNYLLSDTINMTGDQPSDSVPSLQGGGVSATFIDLPPGFPNDKPVFDYQGAGQSWSHAELRGFDVDGNGYDTGANEIGVRLRGAQGVRVAHCRFDRLRYGMRFHNTDSGPPTEFNTLENTDFEIHLATAMHFYRTGANSSPDFRGNGFLDSSITHSVENPTMPPWQVEDVSGQTEKALLYQASFNCAHFGGPVFFSSNVNRSHSGYGSLRIEANDTVMADGSGFLHLDDFVTTLGKEIHGNFLSKGLLSRFGFGSTREWKCPSKWSKTLQSGDTVIEADVSDDWISLFYVDIQSTNYDYRYLLSGTHNGFGGFGHVNTIRLIKSDNGSNAGAPLFSIDNLGRFKIFNPNYNATYTATVYEMPLGSFDYSTTN